MVAVSDLQRLHEPFPREAVSWRAQNLSGDGTKALALAYIDARDVMDRMDAVCGPEGWQDSYEETAKGRVICTISILVDGHWISKADGAGDTAVEGDKGGISDAFKRAAVKWGVGRYLYSLDAPWVPCESREAGNKKYWKRWTVDPWSRVRDAHLFLPQARGTITPKQATPRSEQPKNVIEIADGIAAEMEALRQEFPAASEGFLKLVETLRQTRSREDFVSWQEKADVDDLDDRETDLLQDVINAHTTAIKRAQKQAA